MGAMTSLITSISTVCLAVYSGAHQGKHQSSALLAFARGNPIVTGGFPSQRASKVESVSIWWRHHIYQAIFPFGLIIEEQSNTHKTCTGLYNTLLINPTGESNCLVENIRQERHCRLTAYFYIKDRLVSTNTDSIKYFGEVTLCRSTQGVRTASMGKGVQSTETKLEAVREMKMKTN